MILADLIEEIRINTSPKHIDFYAPLVITANQRQARFIRTQLAGDLTIKIPKVMTIEQWIHDTWLNIQDQGIEGSDKLLLNKHQERCIWEHLIKQHPSLPALIDAESISTYVREAYITIGNYRIPNSKLAENNDAETHFIQSLITNFEEHLHKHKLCTQIQAINCIQELFKKRVLTSFSHVYLYGFVETYPLMDELLCNIAINVLPIEVNTPKYQQLEQSVFDDDTKELEAAAQWAKMQQKEHPERQIAVIVPNLIEVKSKLESIFLKVFDEDFFKDNSRFETNNYFDISASDMLRDAPIVDAVMSLLQLSEKFLTKAQTKKIASSPFWGNGIDNSRLQILEWVNYCPTPSISTRQFIRELISIESQSPRSQEKNIKEKNVNQNQTHSQQSDLFISHSEIEESVEKTDILENIDASHQLWLFKQALNKTTHKATYSLWCEWLIEQLNDVGWPGNRTLNSYEFQAVQNFINSLYNLKHMDCLHLQKTVHQRDFIHQLNQLLKNTPFHVQTKETPLQILGLMEASAIPFDACWITTMHEEQLPSPPNPNPFINLKLQIEYDTPRSSPKREYLYAQKLINQLCEHNKQIIFSYSHDIEQHKKASPLITEYANLIHKQHTDKTHSIHQSYCFAAHERNQHYIPILLGNAPNINEGETIKGGSYHIGLHAKNPLYAFLNYRVGAVKPPEETLGIGAMERGTLIHALMANIFQRYKNKNALATWVTSSNYDTELSDLIDITMLEFIRSKSQFIQPLIQNVEKNILKKRAHIFLQLETHRPDFVVDAIEKSIEVTINNRHLHLRIDRMDMVNIENTTSSSWVIFDYKSGKSSLNGLQSQPIFDCQLPLYLLALTSTQNTIQNKEDLINKIAGVGYIELSASKINYLGILNSDTNDVLNINGFVNPKTLSRYDLPSSWSECVNWWENQLNMLVNELSNGECNFQSRHPQHLAHYQYLDDIIREEEKIT